MKKKILFCFSIVFLFVKTSSAQTWVEKMQDPTVNFYDVQKSFNDFYKKKEQKHIKEENEEKEERAKDAAKKLAKSGSTTSAIPVKGQTAVGSGESEENELAGGWDVYKRWEDYMKPRLFPSGDRSVMINAWNDYLNTFYASSGSGMRAPTPGTPSVLSANWSLIGPTTTTPAGGGAGRVNFVRFDPTTSSTIYVGSPGGGLWKSTTGGTSWTTNTDNLAVMGTTDLAIHPTNPLIMYLATGDGEAQDTYSIGVLKTTNGGTTWNPTGLTWVVTNGRTISRLLINPQNPNTLFAATSNGLYRTLNAGTTWTQIATAVANIKDIEYRPGDTTTVYACSTTLFYKSTNGGTSFTTTSTGLPAAASLSRLAIAVTANDPTYVYVLASNTAYGYQGVYRSTTNGTSFTTMSTTPNLLGFACNGSDTGGQGWYTLSIAVSPTNKNDVYVGGVNIWRSTNGGTSWTINAHWTGGGSPCAAIPYVHADIHALEFLPGSGTTLFTGCDGGFFKTTNSGTSWTDLSNGLQISEAYRIGLSKTNANLLVTGWQDNGTNRWSGTSAWNYIQGGDGMEAIVDWSNANIQYGELYYGQINKTTTGGNLTTSIVSSGGTGVNANGEWVTPYIEAPSNAATLFVGKAQVYKSTNSGTSWAQVGTISGGTGNLVALANAASNINYIYAAKIDKFYVSTTGTAFVDRTAGLPVTSAAISYIAVDPLNASRVWVTFSGYSAANKVWYSADAGVTWSNYSTGLPNLPANCIVYQGSASNDPLYVGTDVGVYYKDNTAGSWTSYSTGLPNVSVRELEIQYTALKLRAATYGRGIWQSDLYNPGTATPTADFTANRTNICVGDCINFTDLSTGSPTSWSWSFPGAATTTSTVQNPTGICYNTAGTYNVTLIATNTNGSNTITKTAYITVSGTTALPLVEGFQGATFVPAGWILNNPDADMTWVQTTTAGGYATSSNSALMDNLTPTTSIAGTVDELLTPKYSFTGVASATMTFDVAYARYNNTYFDSLIVYVSTNCGATWGRVYAKGGNTLKTAPDDSTTTFVPTSTQWRTETVNMTPYAGQANVMVKFQNKSGWGQMLYLDNINITGTGIPVANFSATPTTVCAGQTVSFTDLSTNSPTSWSWTFTGGTPSTSTLQNPVVTYSTAGTYNVTLTATNSGGSSTPVTMTGYIHVNALPATPTASNTGPYCAGSTITLNTPTVTGATYSWTGPSTFTSTTQNPTRPTATTAMAGTYSVTVTTSGCTSLAGTTAVVVHAVPATPTASNTGPYCAGATITLNTPTVTGATYSWTGPSTFTSTTQNPTRPSSTTAMAGTYSVTVTTGGCTSLAGTTAVVVNALPATPTASNTGPYCSGSTITLNTPTVTGATYSWTGPSTFTSTTQNPTRPTATTAMAGTYSVTVTTSGCTSLAGTTAVVVHAGPTALATTTTSASCGTANGAITIGTVTGGTSPYTYSVNASAFTTTTSYTSMAAGTYSVIVKDVNGCTFTTSAVISNSSGPTAVASTTTNSTCGNANGTLNLGAVTGGVSPYTYSIDGSGYTGALSYTGLAAGAHTIIVKDASGCMYTTTITITNTAGPTALAVTTTNSNCGGTDGTITIGTTTGGTASYTYSVNGSGFSTGMAYTGFAAGTYTVIVKDANGCTFSTTTTVNNTGSTPLTPTITQSGSVLTSSSATGNQWYLNGTLIPGATSQNYTFTVNGTYTVVVTTGGCSSAASAPVVITTTGIEEADNPYLLSIYPNPNDGNFTVSFNAAVRSSYKLELYNALGQIIYKDDITGFSGTYTKKLSVTEYGKGVYTITLTNDKNETVKRIIVY